MISFIIPSINRASLKRTIDSIEVWPGDEVIVEFDIPRSNMWGNPQRNKGMERAEGDYLAFIDDDDCYVSGHRQIMEEAIKENPGLPILFQMEYPNGDILWREPKLIPGNVSTPMMLVPNKKEMLYYWKDARNMADFIFMDNWKFKEIIWIKKVIAKVNADSKAINHE